MQRNLTLMLCFAIAFWGMANSASAQDFPTRPVTIVIGFPAGGPADSTARAIADELGRRWSRPVVVQNRPGAAGTLAAASVAGAKPDGYTLLLAVSSQGVQKYVYKNLKYDVVESFTPVALLAEMPNVLVVPPQSPFRDLRHFIASAKVAPAKYSFASQGNGSVSHLAGELLKQDAGIELLHVPYKGVSQGMTDLMGGMNDLSLPSLGSVLGSIRSGQLRALAIAADQRMAIAPDIPTFAEAGLPGFRISTWHGLYAPAGLLPSLSRRLHQDVLQALSAPAVQERLLKQGLLVAPPLTVAEFSKKIQADMVMYEKLVKTVNLNAE